MNCKPGDLAIVIRGVNGFTIHVGKIVRVIDLAFPSHSKLGAIWNIELSRAVKTSAFKSNLQRIGGDGLNNRCHCADDWLRPLPGETVFDEIVEESPIPKEVETA